MRVDHRVDLRAPLIDFGVQVDLAHPLHAAFDLVDLFAGDEDAADDVVDALDLDLPGQGLADPVLFVARDA